MKILCTGPESNIHWANILFRQMKSIQKRREKSPRGVLYDSMFSRRASL